MARVTKQLRATAYHEAGHAVAAEFFHVAYSSVSVVPNLEKGHLGIIETEPKQFNSYWEDPETKDERERRVIVSFAGLAAEAKFLGRLRWTYGAIDFDNALHHAIGQHYQRGTLYEAEAYLKYLWTRTVAFLNQPLPWKCVEAVALRLIEKPELSRAAVQRLLRGCKEKNIELLTADPPMESLKDKDQFEMAAYLLRRGLHRTGCTSIRFESAGRAD